MTVIPAAAAFIFHLKKLTTTSLGYKMKVYRSSARDCGPCPLRSVCIGKSDFKKIDDSVDKPYYDRMHPRLQTVNREKIRQIRRFHRRTRIRHTGKLSRHAKGKYKRHRAGKQMHADGSGGI